MASLVSRTPFASVSVVTQNREHRGLAEISIIISCSLSFSVICHVVGITYQTIGRRLLAEMLGDPLGKSSAAGEHHETSQSAVLVLTPSVCLSRHAGEGLDEQARLDGKRGGADLHLQPGREHQAQEHRGEDRL